MKNTHRFFEQLVKAYASDLYRYAFWLAKERTVAEDLVQETFARAWKAIDNLRDEKAAKSWLMTILRRENARRFEKQSAEWIEIEEELVAELQSAEPDEKLERQILHQAMMTLENDFKEPLLLQVIWGYSGEEIAEQLGLKLATVNTRLFRARQKLTHLLSQPDTAQKVLRGQK